MFLVNLDPLAMIAAMPRGGVVAEIGVAAGDLSAQILQICRPARLHLIDPWEKQAVDDGGLDPNNLPNDAQEVRYRAVLDRFAGPVAAGQVFVHRAYSQAIAGQFPDGYFDWVYVDGSHLYEHVVADLRLYAPKLKPDGLFLGDDYVNGGMYDRMKFGVIPAVHDFLRESGQAFLALGARGTFLLAKAPASVAAQQALFKVLSAAGDFLVEVRDPTKHDVETRSSRLADGKHLFYVSL
ncbi:MAG: class I SAM-dependent methyltransferase [Alphaproteobacteria bacterium]|nr:class I SAM-dependent methyltransferase [Alphaproteobacteria bacterium]